MGPKSKIFAILSEIEKISRPISQNANGFGNTLAYHSIALALGLVLEKNFRVRDRFEKV